MAKVKEGDRVRVATREQTEEDIKANIYFGYYGGLTGVVTRVYNENEVTVEIEPESLTRDIRKRHEDVRDQMKTKWLDGLSEEGRSKLTEREKDFNLRFIILTKVDDLEKIGARPVPPVKAAPAEAVRSTAETEPVRKTLAELEAAEEAELRKRQQA
jgi:hypothetical protein